MIGMKSKFRVRRDVVEDILDAETWCQWAISVGLHHVASATYLSIHVTNTGKQLIGAPAADASSCLCSNDFMSSCTSRRCRPSRILAMAPQSASFESIVWTPARIVIAYPCSTILSLQQLRLAARNRIYFSPTASDHAPTSTLLRRQPYLFLHQKTAFAILPTRSLKSAKSQER